MSKKKNFVKIRQGQIWFADMNAGTIESEQGKTRPVLIISANVRNDSSPNVFVFPITHSMHKKGQPCHYALMKSAYPWLTYDENLVICEEGRSISKSRLERCLGTISEQDVLNILQIKEYVFVEC